MSRIGPCSLQDAYRWSRRDGWVRVHTHDEGPVQGAPAASEEQSVITLPDQSSGKRGNARKGWTKDTIVKRSTAPKEVPKIYTQAMFRTFDRLSAMACSGLVSDRARARVWLDRFIQKNGSEIVDAILEDIRKRDAEEWFKDKSRRKGA